MWLFVHILFLIGFRNRFIVIVEWAWTYLRNDRGARLITGDVEPLLERGAKRESRADAVEVKSCVLLECADQRRSSRSSFKSIENFTFPRIFSSRS